MKHYIVELTYTAPLETIDRILPDHRAFLQAGYDRKQLLMSGPQTPRTGGIVVARAESRQAVEALFADDPYARARAATYRFVEFTPVKHQPELAGWV